MSSNCRVHYRDLKTSELELFSGDVRTGIYLNPTVFINPPVSLEDFDSSRADYITSAAEYKKYGITIKTTFVNCRSSFLKVLDRLVVYTDEIAQGDVSTIALSGFIPSREGFQRVASLEKIENFSVAPSVVSGRAKVVIPAITDKGVLSYCCICVEGAPLSNTSITNGQFVTGSDNPPIHYDFNKSRVKVFDTLKAGTQYFFYVFAHNSVGVSPLSDCKSIWVS